MTIPLFPGRLRKNDALFMFGAGQPLPFVTAYAQETVEVVHGPSCTPANEVHLDHCDSDKVPVIERRGGGGTVVLAPGMVVTIVVGVRLPQEGIRDIFSRVHRGMIGILDPAGDLGIVETGISDLAIDGRKILGSSLYLPHHPRLFFYQSSLIVTGDLTLISRYLAHPPKEPPYRHGRMHGDFCTSLQRCGYAASAEETAKRLAKLVNSEPAVAV